MLTFYHVQLDGFPDPAGMPRFLEVLPPTVEPWLRERLELGGSLSEEERERPRFAGVELSIGEAYALLARLRQTGANGYLVPGRYRTPRLSVEESLAIAERELRERISGHRTFRSFRFEPVRLNVSWSTPMFRVFQAYSPDMDEHGYIPASLSVQVDTQDGHLWGPEEFFLLRERLEEDGRRALGLPRMESPSESSRLERRKRRGKLKRVKP
ncbi:hypothetical protein BO221_04630 [Archangium sp. Cb G35]|uniref:hypothetical protein n=1 Tax=Archangium sp. Cb G35 TaxID=1920190 RepID=UPI0009369269|nr:hypothetical protein [Archangium sp. Cb G35]OJT27274.1 hypothetical protein BO221_04630 [Archangium sp. Cb G35]